MRVEEFASVELVERIRKELASCLDNIGIKEGFRRDRLMTELTEDIALSFV